MSRVYSALIENEPLTRLNAARVRCSLRHDTYRSGRWDEHHGDRAEPTRRTARGVP